MSFSILVYCIQYNLSQCNVNPADPHRETYRMDMSILQTTDNNTFVCAKHSFPNPSETTETKLTV